MTSTSLYLADEKATEKFGRALAAATKVKGLVYLVGDLGAGKTTLARGVMRALGHKGAVKSPTYTLVEPYELQDKRVYHFDLYRLEDPEELEYMGVWDYLNDEALCLVEWPEKGEGLLPTCDLEIVLTTQDSGRSLTWCSHTQTGHEMSQRLKRTLDQSAEN